jgi:hypothetical protein
MKKEVCDQIQIRHAKPKKREHQELTRQYVSASINCTLIVVVISKQPSVMSFLHHDKSNWRLVVGLQGCTGLFPWFREDSQRGESEEQSQMNPYVTTCTFLMASSSYNNT